MTTSAETPLEQLTKLGVSIWLDDLSRQRIASGNLSELIRESRVSGVTTNPTIFANAVREDELYITPLKKLASEGFSPEAAITRLMCDDVRGACDLFAQTYRDTQGYDGRVSIEVPPALANDAQSTVATAVTIWEEVDRPNVLIKVPATAAGLEATTALLELGISVNVTLIFSLNRYREVLNAYLTGLELARAAGRDLTQIHSVASFFVSRLDTAVDDALREVGTPRALDLLGKSAVANAQLAYGIFVEVMGSERARYIRQLGANVQRPLWASTGVKDPALPETLYVTELAGADTVNTMPEKTLAAFAANGQLHGDSLTGSTVEANAILNELEHLGISYTATVDALEQDGIRKFVDSYTQLVHTAEAVMAR